MGPYCLQYSYLKHQQIREHTTKVVTGWKRFNASVSDYIKPILAATQKKTKIGFHDQLLLNAGQKYCRMLQAGAFCNTFDLHKAIIDQFCLPLSGRLRQV